MVNFLILKKSKISKARLGQLITPHGVVETPCLVPVATQAVIKTLDSQEVKETQSQILIANTFHLHLKPGPARIATPARNAVSTAGWQSVAGGEKFVKSAGGLHKFMNWGKPLMTDSGGFQVFSLGFGQDFGTGKILKNQPAQKASLIEAGRQPKLIKITDSGVYFNSPLNGQKLFLGPKESIKIQEDLAADIIFAFDECTSPLADYEYTKKSLLKTHQWAKVCLAAKKSEQALFGIIQGGRYKDLRIESAKFIGKLAFDGFGIGGEFGNNKRIMSEMLKWVIKELPQEKPRHLLGIGYLADIPKIIKAGVDTFDCIVPTHYARRGRAFTSQGELDLEKSNFLKDKNPLDKNCSCFVCQNYKRNYISHLFRAKEITALKLLTFHNLYFFNTFIENIRQQIRTDKF